MKMIADRKILLNAARTAAKAAESPALSPYRACMLLQADYNGNLKLTCNNLENAVQKRVTEVKVLEEGSIVITAELLCNMLRLLGEETVTIETNERLMCFITSGNASYSFMTLDPGLFPNLALPFPEDTIRVMGLPRLIRQTVFAAADKSLDNPALEGVQITFASDQTSAAATDGRRLALARTERCADGSLSVLIHQKSLGVLMGVIRPDDELYVGISGKSVVMFKEDLVFTARLLENSFVDIGTLMQSIKKVYGASCDSKAMLNAFEAAHVIAKNSGDAYVRLDIGETNIRLQTAGKIGATSPQIDAYNTTPTPEKGFYYFPWMVAEYLRFTEGIVELSINEKGYMLLDASGYRYMVVPRQPPKPTLEKEKTKAASPKAKKQKKPKASKSDSAA